MSIPRRELLKIAGMSGIALPGLSTSALAQQGSIQSVNESFREHVHDYGKPMVSSIARFVNGEVVYQINNPPQPEQLEVVNPGEVAQIIEYDFGGRKQITNTVAKAEDSIVIKFGGTSCKIDIKEVPESSLSDVESELREKSQDSLVKRFAQRDEEVVK